MWLAVPVLEDTLADTEHGTCPATGVQDEEKLHPGAVIGGFSVCKI